MAVIVHIGPQDDGTRSLQITDAETKRPLAWFALTRPIIADLRKRLKAVERELPK